MRAKRAAEDKENVSTATAGHDSEIFNGLSMYRSRFPYCTPDMFLPKKKIRPTAEATGRSQAPMKNRHNYIKPGTLAQWRDQRKRLAEVTAIANMERPAVPGRLPVPPLAVPLSGSPERVPVGIGIVPRSGGPACLRRKKLLAPQFSLTAQTTAGNDPAPMVEEPAAAPPAATTVEDSPPVRTPVRSAGELTPFESLPVELLVRIVCFLDHGDLQPVFHVCQALRHAVIIARQEYFDFTTPGKFHPSEYRMRLLTDGGNAPAAPIKHTPNSLRVSEAVMAELSTRLFPVTLPEATEAQRRSWLASRPNRTRALFSEEELCKAIAENTL